MIRSTLFKSVAPALRDSLNDAEVGALGMWLLMSAGVHPTGCRMYAKDGEGLGLLEQLLAARYSYPDEKTPEDVMTGGSVNPEYRLPIPNRNATGSCIAGLEDLLYTISASNEERDNPHRDTVVPATEGAGVPAWQVNPFVERTAPAPPQENRIVGREARANPIPRFDLDQLRVFQQRLHADPEQEAVADEQAAIAVQAEAANLEHIRQVNEWMQRAREREQARVDVLANRTRGIPNRR